MIKAVNYDTIYINIKRLFLFFSSVSVNFGVYGNFCSSLFMYWKWGELFSYFFGRVFIWNQVLRD